MAIEKIEYTLVCDRCGKKLVTWNPDKLHKVKSSIKDEIGNNCVNVKDVELCDDCYKQMYDTYNKFWGINKEERKENEIQY